jgi:ubiquinone/menaquinone biosynthesis C-methylase UbiE
MRSLETQPNGPFPPDDRPTPVPPGRGTLSKDEKRRHFDSLAPRRDAWRRKNRLYYADQEALLTAIVPAGSSVLEIGCGTGDLLAQVRPRRGLGIDFSQEMIRVARSKYPAERHANLEFRVGDAEDLQIDEKFDYVVVSDLLGELTDVWSAFRNLRNVVREDTRVVITYFNALWEPVVRAGEKLGLKMPQDYQNWMSTGDLANLLDLNGFEIVTRGHRLPFPKQVPLVAPFVNRLLGNLPVLHHLGITAWAVARPRREAVQPVAPRSVTVVVPCRNEKGNIRDAVERVPDMGSHTEIIFVDGNSNDGTVEEIERIIREQAGRRDVKLIHQVPPGSTDGASGGKMLKLGKGDAVRKGFAAASGDILMILDADLTVPPEELPKFYMALFEARGDFVNGSRLVYPMEREAMRFLNKLANKFFGALFTWLIGQRLKDTLCGTKVLFKRDYEKIVAGRDFFGDFDPFGDFDLLFGAAKQNLKIVEVPIRYRERTYGDVKIERFKHGLLLLRMSGVALFKLKLR